MKKRLGKRLLSMLLAVILCVQLLPMAALASLLDNDPAYNREILSMLEDIVGSEDEAERYYAILQQYGLLDEDGNMPESWEIWMDGEPVTLEDLRTLLDSGDYDPDHYLLVDNTPVTLGDLKTILEIEDYLAYLQATYFDGHQWTAEQLENLDSLVAQINSEGIMFRAASNGGTDVDTWPDGISHEARVNVTTNFTDKGSGLYNVKGTLTCTATLTDAEPGQVVTFQYTGMSGTLVMTGSGTVTLTADDNGEAEKTFSVTVDSDGYHSSLSFIGYVRLTNLTNALFQENEKRYLTLTYEDDTKAGKTKDTMLAIWNYLNQNGLTREGSIMSIPAEEGIKLDNKDYLLKYALNDGQFYALAWNVFTDAELVIPDYGYPWMGGGSLSPQIYTSSKATIDLDYVPDWNSTPSTPKKEWVNDSRGFSSLTEQNGELAESPDLAYCGIQIQVEQVSSNSLDKKPTYLSTQAGQKYGNPVWNQKLDGVLSFQRGYTGDSVLTIEYPNPGDLSVISGWQGDGTYYVDEYPGDPTCKVSELLTDTSDTAAKELLFYNRVYSYSCVINGHQNNARQGEVLFDTSYVEYENIANNDTYFSEFEADQPDLQIQFSRSEKPAITKIVVPNGPFFPGETIPIRVTFSEPVRVNDLTLDYQSGAVTDTLRPYQYDYWGTEWGPAYYGSSDCVVFLYRVPDMTGNSWDGTLRLGTISGAEDLRGTSVDSRNVNETITLDMDDEYNTVTGLTAEISNPTTEPLMKVYASINNQEKVTNWLSNTWDLSGENPKSTVLFVRVDDDETYYPLMVPFGGANITGSDNVVFAEIPLKINNEETAVSHAVTLYLYDKTTKTYSPLIGKYVIANQLGAKFVKEGELTAALSVMQSDGETPYAYADSLHTIYLQDKPKIRASYTLTGTDYSYSGADQFKWESSDTSIANIDEEGNITPTGKAGQVTFTVTALNGGVADKAVTAVTDELTFGVGLTPFINIPNDNLSAVDGQAVTIFWTSNICDKKGETDTTFNISVKRDGAEQEKTYSVTGRASNPVASFTIPAGILTYTYTPGVKNTFTVTVTVEYEGKTYPATATITLVSQPAEIMLTNLNSYYITDTARSVNINWTIEHFNQYSGENDLFKLYITKDGADVETITDPGSGTGGSYTGSYTLGIDSITADKADPTSYRQIYTVTIQAKNGSDSTWSYDSFLLYVYDADALKIMVDGAREDSVLMSNIDKVTDTTKGDLNTSSWRDYILGMKRDIYLQKIISVNYGEYAWNEIADQIAWASSNNDVATVNYQQGTLYEDIRSFSYVSYRPTTEFGLSGLSDGKTIVTATHKLTGIRDSLTVDVETLKDQLYLFQCYPQTTTKLRYQDSTGAWQEVTSDGNGAAAIYEANGIHSNVYCSSDVNGKEYLGTFYLSDLKTGEGDWTKLERYPCNNLTLRQAAYVYLYVKTPGGGPYTGNITFRGGVYLNGEYLKDARFKLGSKTGQPGNVGQTVPLDMAGRLTIAIDQTQLGNISAQDKVSYVFMIKPEKGIEYYPMLLNIDATVNEDDFVGTGEAIVNFRENPEQGEHPFVAMQAGYYEKYGEVTNLLDFTGKVGPSASLPRASVTTAVMWWGEDAVDTDDLNLQLVTESGVPIADGTDANGTDEYKIEHTVYPFIDEPITRYTVNLNANTLDSILESGKSTGVYLNYYDGGTLKRHESLPFQLCNMLHLVPVEQSKDVSAQIQSMGNYIDTGTRGHGKEMGIDDEFVNIALDFVSSSNYSTGDDKLFSIQISPTVDPTKFLGFIEVNVGNMNDKQQVTGVYAQESTSGKSDIDKSPGLNELMTIAGKRSFYSYLADDFNKVLKREGVRNLNFQLGGYAESLIYYNENSGHWEIQILDGGFNLGGGASYTWNKNFQVGPVPFTASLTIGGTVEVSMDALTVAYFNQTTNTSGLGNDFLTELRIYLYLRFFAGVGFDYAVVAFKLGIYGQISLDMQFQWLNRPYMDAPYQIINVADGKDNGYKDGKVTTTTTTLPTGDVITTYQSENSTRAGQHFKIDGQIGLEFVVRVLFFSYEKILYSYSFNLLNKGTQEWTSIQTDWAKNQAASQAAISKLLGNKSLSVSNVGGQQMLSLNLAPTLESRDYLNDGGRVWGSGGISLFSLDDESALKNLEYNSYPYANPVISDDGQLVAYLSDMDSSEVTDTRAAYAVMGSGGFFSNADYADKGAIDNDGYGDSQVSLSGTKDFAVAAWTRQTKSIDKDAGAGLTNEDQMIMMNSSEIYAGVYQDGKWTLKALTENSTADLAPVVATNGTRAIVAWRAVSSSGGTPEDGYIDVTSFDEKDTILYRIYDPEQYTENTEDEGWSETQTLYNGTSGSVKGIVAAMLDDGTAAVAYALDSDKNDDTIYDREIYYAVVDKDKGEVTRNVRATNDAYLDENPQLTAVTFPSAEDEQRFVLGWYTKQAVASDSASTLDAGETATTNTTTSDIRLLDFDKNGIYTQLLPDSISQAADAYDVAITPTFRFTKNSPSINDLSILWVERAGGTIEALKDEEDNDNVDKNPGGIKVDSQEKDVLKGVKFYAHGQYNEIISFTGAVDVAEMEDDTLIDHFDAYVSDPDTNQIKAVILGTTYGEGDPIDKTAETVGGDTVSFSVPSRTSSMYTATETYSDKIDVPAILPEYATIKKGATTQIQFTVKNNGIHAISELKIKVGDTTTPYSDLNLLPGDSIQLWADYTVPATGVEDPQYTVTATFNDKEGATGSAETGGRSGIFGLGAKSGSNEVSDTVYLDLPDVEITDAKIVEEVGGKRTIQIKLNNDSDATLTKSGRSVKIGFYTDATCETPFPTGYGLDPITVSTVSDLTMLDEGGYSVQRTFAKIADYLKEISEEASNPLTEIPDSGITVYIRAEVLEGSDVLPEPIYSNNYAAVTAENLKTRTGKDVSITSNFAVDGSDTVVTAYLQNNRLSQTQTGNVIVTLLDAAGEVISQKQSYTGNTDDNGLLTLGKEEKRTETFTFTGVTNAASVQVVYSDLIIGANNADLTSLAFSNIPGITLASFEKGTDGIYRAAVSTDDLTSTAVTVVPESSSARASAYSNKNSSESGDGGKAISKTVALNPGETNTITVTVVNGDKSKTYILTVQNNGDPVIDAPTYTPDSGTETQYGTSVYYGADNSVTINLTTVMLETERLTYQWYSCDAAGKNTKLLTDETTSTLTVPGGTDADVYYYRCLVTRHYVDGSTKTYWSSVASVQINPASGNSVTLGGIEVTFDNQPHDLASATAAKEGSTLHYSTDGGETWSKTAPTFTSVGVHTVWVKATNPNYVDTAVMTADVVIQEKSGTLFNLETQSVAELYDSYPDEIKELYRNAGSLSTALADAMKKMGVSEKNIAVYGAKLMFSLDDGATWTEATAENFPAAGMTVTIPYPEGTNRSSYNFILNRLVIDPLASGKKAGAVEAVDITLTPDGISFTADCLSALVLGWYLRPTSNPSYTVATEDSKHGTFTVSPSRASYSSTVTITAKPDEGYKVGKVTVTTQNGRELTVTNKGNNLYTFKMPYGSVSVEVSFVKSTEAVTNPFTDVPSSAYYHDAVLWAVENGVTSGTTDTTFSPDLACTRAQAVTFLWRAAGSPAPKAASSSFQDVSTGAYYYDAVLWAVEHGITAGTSATTFSPNATCTRAQIVTFLWRAADSTVETASNPFSDVSAGAYYYDAVLWAVKNGITAGTSATTFSPDLNCTRAQIVTFLYRAKV